MLGRLSCIEDQFGVTTGKCPRFRAFEEVCANAPALMRWRHRELMSACDVRACEVRTCRVLQRRLDNNSPDKLSFIDGDKAGTGAHALRGNLDRLIHGRVIEPHRAKLGICSVKQASQLLE